MKEKYLLSIIESNSHEKISQISKFISSFQNDQRFSVGNFPISTREIEMQIREYLRKQPQSFFQVAHDRFGKIRGFFGAAFSDSNTIRLFGPFAIEIENEWEEIAEKFLHKILEKYQQLKNGKLRVAFTQKNTCLKSFYTKHGFMQYNAERTLIFDRNQWHKERIGTINNRKGKIKIRPYKKSDFVDLLKIHPRDAYFKADDMVKNLNSLHRLLIAVLDEQIVGYVYYEDFEADGLTDICFLNVMQYARNRNIGTMLVKKAIGDSFQNRKIKKIEISVRVDNIAAFRLYQRLGFSEKSTYLAYELKL